MNIIVEMERLTQPLAASKVRRLSPEEIAQAEGSITPPHKIPFLHELNKVSFPPYQGKHRAIRK